MHRVTVKNEEPTNMVTKVTLDGQPIRVRGVKFDISTDTVPSFEFDLCALPDIDMDGLVELSFTPKTVEEANAVIRRTIYKNEGYRDMLYSRIRLSLRRSGIDREKIADDKVIQNIIEGLYGERSFNFGI